MSFKRAAVAAFALMAMMAPALAEGHKAKAEGTEFRRSNPHQYVACAIKEGHLPKHLERLKTKLDVQPSQEQAWRAFVGDVESAVKPIGADCGEDKRDGERLTLPERLAKMTEKRAVLDGVQAAVVRLYAELTPAQKEVADKLHPHELFGFGGKPGKRGHGHEDRKGQDAAQADVRLPSPPPPAK